MVPRLGSGSNSVSQLFVWEMWELPGKPREKGRRGGKCSPAEVRLCLHHITEEHGSLGSKGRAQRFSRENSSVPRGIWGIHGPTEGRAGREGEEEPTPHYLVSGPWFIVEILHVWLLLPKNQQGFGDVAGQSVGNELNQLRGVASPGGNLGKKAQENKPRQSHPNHGNISTRESFGLEKTSRMELILLHFCSFPGNINWEVISGITPQNKSLLPLSPGG